MVDAEEREDVPGSRNLNQMAAFRTACSYRLTFLPCPGEIRSGPSPRRLLSRHDGRQRSSRPQGHNESIRRHRDVPENVSSKSVDGDFALPVRGIEQAEEAGPVDLVIIAVKAFDVESAREAVRPAVGPETAVF